MADVLAGKDADHLPPIIFRRSSSADHLPLYRQSQIFDREGLDLDRFSLTGRVGKSAALLEPLADAIGRHALTRMERLRPYLDHGILELGNNAAGRGMRAIAPGRKNSLFGGAKAAAFARTLIETAKCNAVDPHPWLAETRTRIPDCKINGLLPWRWNR